MSQCKLVYPVWVVLGWVQWPGQPRERLFALERKTCTGASVESVESRGFVFHLCAEHAREMKDGKLFAWKEEEEC